MKDILELAYVAQELLLSYRDLIETIIYFGLALIACKIFHIDVASFPKNLLREFRDLLKLKPTTGAINAIALIILFATFVFLAFGEKIATLFSFLSRLIGDAKTKELLTGAVPFLALALFVFAIFSVRTVSKVESDAARRRHRRSK
jgi:hypothetical protein